MFVAKIIINQKKDKMLKPITFQLPEDTIADLQKFVLKQKLKKGKEKISQQSVANEAIVAFVKQSKVAVVQKKETLTKKTK